MRLWHGPSSLTRRRVTAAALLALVGFACAGCGLSTVSLTDLLQRPAGAPRVTASLTPVLGGEPPAVLVSSDRIHWVGSDGRGRPVLESLAVPRQATSVSLADGHPIATLGLHVGPQQSAALLAPLGGDGAIVTVTDTTGTDQGVAAQAWAMDRRLHQPLVDLAPAGTRPLYVRGQTVVTGGGDGAILGVGASAGFPGNYAPRYDLETSLTAGGGVTTCRLVEPVPPALVWPTGVGTEPWVADESGALVGLGPCRAGGAAPTDASLGRLPPGVYPLLVGTSPGAAGGLQVTWVAGQEGSRVGAWRPDGHAGAWRAIWSIQAATASVEAVPPGYLLVTAASGASTSSRLYAAASGASAGPWTDMTPVAAGPGALLVDRDGHWYLLRPTTSTG